MGINTVLCVLSLCILQQFTLLCTTELLFNLLLGLKGYIILNACIYIYIYIIYMYVRPNHMHQASPPKYTYTHAVK